MSRSYHQHHKMQRKEKCPSPYRDNEGTQDKHRKMRPYGCLGYCGWGGEIFIKKWGEIMLDLVNKRKARRDAKKQILEQLYDDGNN